LPLHIEILYQEQISAAFAVASLLAGLALVTLVLKYVVEQRMKQQIRHASGSNGETE
jgi:sulfate transport system permease protein